jgi:hypothetical protein
MSSGGDSGTGGSTDTASDASSSGRMGLPAVREGAGPKSGSETSEASSGRLPRPGLETGVPPRGAGNRATSHKQPAAANGSGFRRS